ncbi:TonB-dependent siderophore receptor [Novosphingobium sp. B-7]|uniref:TonB-dependent siderophore receptor n=1 Tax=Novosphingobium sp. B-7 TaxID=1298855 RepID=UPI0003B32236|nr:TonB-dependent siderophore receptor [Novosphingobium sp. B-7]
MAPTHLRHAMLACGVSLGVLAAAPAHADSTADAASASASDADAGRTIVVNGEKGETVASGATGLALSLMDTPQSVSVVDRKFLDDFALDETNQLLRYVTGVNVDQVETERTYYNARGFDIVDAMIDGISLPNIWGPTIGAQDSVMWDNVEVVRGANALLTGAGNPSGTINYHRRHPTGQRHMSAELSYGSWNKKRAEVDLDLPLTADGKWAVRVTGAAQDGDSYLRSYHHSRTAISGVLDGEITPNLHLSAGYMRQDGKSTGVMWGALPLQDSKGNQLEFDRSASTTMDWTYWNTHDQTAYGQLTWDFAPGWSVRAHVTRKYHNEDSRLFYVYGTPKQDSQTGAWGGLFGNPGAYAPVAKGWIYDGTVQGGYRLFGRDQQLTLGVQRTVGTYEYYGRAVPDSDPAWGQIPGLPGSWTGQEVALPAYGASVQQEHTEDRQWRLRGASDVSLTEKLSVLLGASYLVEKTRGISFGASTDKNEKALSPFVGVTYKALPGVNLYASYSSIFAPQANLDIDRRPLGAAKGKSYEAGLKAQTPGGGLFGSVAWFRAEQSNLADAGAYDTATGQTLYNGIRAVSRGVEAEVGGKLTSTLTIQAGATTLKMDDGAGRQVRTYVPRNTANLALRWNPIAPLQLGAAVKWQDTIYSGTVRQGDYATLQLQAGYKLNENVQFNFNVANVTNHKYLTSLYWTQAYYAAPRNVTGSVRVTF